MLRRAVPALVALVAACEFPSAGRFPCGPEGECADGNICLDQLCVPEPSTCAKAVSAGLEHTCAIRSDGSAWCWGRNDADQLGDGSSVDQTSPTKVAADASFAAIAAGYDHTCALADDKTVWCWGSNVFGQLASPSLATVPRQVEDLAGVTAISSGNAFSCALADGKVQCWGTNRFGQLGNNSTQESRVPAFAQIPDGVVVTSLVAADDTTCAIAGTSLYCWGENHSSQFANSGMVLHTVPVAVSGPEAVQVAVGEDSICVLTPGGDVQCAGDTSFSQLGNPRAVPGRFLRASLAVPASAVAMGAHFGCAIEVRDEDHPQRAWCWGDNRFNQISPSTNFVEGSPIVTDYANVAALSTGGLHACALSAAGGITCSGLNSRGQIGDGVRTTQAEPPPVIAGLTGATSIAAGGAHSCAVTGDGSVMCWGDNAVGQLGDGTTRRRSRPVRVEGVAQAVEVVAGGAHTCARLADGTAMCWGLNSERQVGDGTSEFRAAPGPVVIDSQGTKLGGIVQLAAGAVHTCAVVATGAGNTMACWGDNSQGQLGDGSFSTRNVAGPVAMLPGSVQEIALGRFHTCALIDGAVRCWGINGLGQLGNASYLGNNSSQPVAVQGLAPAAHIAADGDFTCAIIAQGGAVWCWGSGGAGQMGNGEFRGFLQPEEPVDTLANARMIAGGGGHACAVNDGGLACWGASNLGQVGNGRYESRPAPAQISLPGDAGVSALAAGDQHTCALLEGGTVTCWGDGRSGQLGDGALDRKSRTAPQLPCP